MEVGSYSTLSTGTRFTQFSGQDHTDQWPGSYRTVARFIQDRGQVNTGQGPGSGSYSTEARFIQDRGQVHTGQGPGSYSSGQVYTAVARFLHIHKHIEDKNEYKL